MKKTITRVLAAVSALCFSLGLTACNFGGSQGGQGGNDTHEHTYSEAWTSDETYHWHTATCEHADEISGKAAHAFEGNTCSVCGYTQTGTPSSLTLAEFVTEHRAEAVAFINRYIRPSVVGEKEVLSENWGLTANSEDELSGLRLFWTYKQDETSRAIEVANITMTNPIDLDDIVADNVDGNSLSFSTSNDIVFEFDAKENFQNQDLASALYNITGDSSSVMTYSEVETTREGVRTFLVSEETQDHQLKIYNVDTDCGNSTEELIENLNYPYNYLITEEESYSLGEYQLNVQNYTQEEFAPEKVDDLIEDYNEAITTALEENFFDTITRTCYGRTFDESKLLTSTWDIGNGEEISEIKFISTYATSPTNTMYTIGTIKLDSPIMVNNLTKSNINETFAEKTVNATSAMEYLFQYNPQKQNDRNDLVNAIFEAYGMTKEVPEGATRYYIDKGSRVDSALWAETHVFQVVEIQDNYVKEFTISIKLSSNDQGYIEKLQDSSNYRVYSEKSYEMNGQKVSSEEKQEEIQAMADTQ